ncbi:MAG TPA: ATPase domain-containing protein [Ktedonobacterales bacterium]|jgi:circadian clock protein KaiC|nr:ATPase domain-containing protein [Ktedonobacterales bacterium]
MPRGALATAVGPPGSGKTTLACEIAFAAAQTTGSGLVLTTLSETSTKLIAHLRSFRFFDPDLVGIKLRFLSVEPILGKGLSATADEMVAIARNAQASLIVLDGFRGVRESDVNLQAARRFLYTVGTRLGVLDTTTLITSEMRPHDPKIFTDATTADVIIGLHYSREAVRQGRAREVVKVRGGQILPGASWR